MRPARAFALMSSSLLVLTLCLAGAARAHEGHDHGAPAPLSLPIAPRVVAASTGYELVGIRSGRTRLTIFLTSYASNEPVKDAAVAVQAGAEPRPAPAKGDGVFELDAPWLDTAGPLDLVFHLATPNGRDLLSGQLPAAAATAGPATGGKPAGPTVAVHDLLPFAAGLLIGALLMLTRRRSPQQLAPPAPGEIVPPHPAEASSPALRRASTILAICLVAGALVGTAAPAMSAEATPTAPPPTIPSTMATDLAQRLADGTLFVPKATQHLLSIRTMVVTHSEPAQAKELPGSVVPDPNTFARVQGGHSGRLEAPEGGLPHLGQRVIKGDLIAILVPHIGVVERGGLESQIAEADARIAAQRVRIARLRSAPLAVPPIKVEEAEGELNALQERRRLLDPTLSHRHEIRAPISGVVSKTGFFAGQVVDPRDVLFEIADPKEFWIEAVAYDPAAADGLIEATAALADGTTLPLTYAGRGLTLREQTAPLMFKVAGPVRQLSIGQPVRVILRTAGKTAGFVVPASSVVRGNNGLPLVWVKAKAERFEPQSVKVAPLDGDRVVVTAGLKSNQRVVTDGATLINQVR